MELTLDMHLQLLEWVPKWGITRDPERAEGRQGPPATLEDPQNTISLGRKMLPQGLLPCDSHTGLPAPNNSAFALAVCWHLPLPFFTQEGELQGP